MTRHPLGAVAFLLGFQLALVMRAAGQHHQQVADLHARALKLADDALALEAAAYRRGVADGAAAAAVTEP